MNILTFNHHESYLCTLARTGHNFDVIINYNGLDLSWNQSARPLPKNMNLKNFDNSVKTNLKAGYYDYVVCHTIKNLIWLLRYPNTKLVFIAHIPLFYFNFFQRIKSVAKRLTYSFVSSLRVIKFVAVSEFKRKSWGIAGNVIVLSPEKFVDTDTSHNTPKKSLVVVVCNQLIKRSKELGANVIFGLPKTLPIVIIGNNPGVSNSIRPPDFKTFREEFVKGTIYLYTIQQPYGDGYNTAMLEAMSQGMAVVTLSNPSSPITHGINGLVANSVEELSQHLFELIKNPEKSTKLGIQAKNTIDQMFSSDLFLAGWRDILI